MLNLKSRTDIACISSPAWAVDPATLPMVVQMQKAANAATCESYKGDTSPLGKAVNKQCRNRAKAEFEDRQDENPLRDCIKPGNVIDDDVRKCMKGM
ncbi:MULTISPECIES: hypothetical protein [Pseudomonas]|uniref:Uncharacterized protein n=3 Tax=Pseudomonas syringae group genomosp. 2 TaxID=251698 RepID=A0AB73Q0H3_PSESS|nr:MULTISPECIES: hypothetical protein [Pseudomonas]KAA3534260.1 hypothetical protein DXU85_25900 [Pseudomonas savastanoi]MCQ3021116.1 hypothetical protein [Pseudomonas savastanoi]MDT3222866.1 hypothetical protein [Pseudomonas amygdali pv. morsprunorum]MDT3244460.1 hypothetical protein [Pseudomonas amygdali pv. morsprunorum]MDT3269075.1 hypothetical protein [Pseudomonas amygdali pv. morsprunorum]